ncbi:MULTISPECIES: hypothetical protein [Halorussus]|uniref:hypothetical protein n=1 Tax=Halorussus TaxID=1070314 RepID=UPI0020A1839C|nr:hypothetical protein [Halorussus vallis]USZ77435.1 hypothetical protein NGM07_08905 [Halorussus vallis]
MSDKQGSADNEVLRYEYESAVDTIEAQIEEANEVRDQSLGLLRIIFILLGIIGTATTYGVSEVLYQVLVVRPYCALHFPVCIGTDLLAYWSVFLLFLGLIFILFSSIGGVRKFGAATHNDIYDTLSQEYTEREFFARRLSAHRNRIAHLANEIKTSQTALATGSSLLGCSLSLLVLLGLTIATRVQLEDGLRPLC